MTEVMVNGPNDGYVEREGRIERVPSGEVSPSANCADGVRTTDCRGWPERRTGSTT
jgi:hypothetical protein